MAASAVFGCAGFIIVRNCRRKCVNLNYFFNFNVSQTLLGISLSIIMPLSFLFSIWQVLIYLLQDATLK